MPRDTLWMMNGVYTIKLYYRSPGLQVSALLCNIYSSLPSTPLLISILFHLHLSYYFVLFIYSCLYCYSSSRLCWYLLLLSNTILLRSLWNFLSLFCRYICSSSFMRSPFNVLHLSKAPADTRGKTQLFGASSKVLGVTSLSKPTKGEKTFIIVVQGKFTVACSLSWRKTWLLTMIFVYIPVIFSEIFFFYFYKISQPLLTVY